MGQVIWTAHARQDLKEVVEHIAHDSRAYAESFGLRILEKVGRLEQFPESGPIIPEVPEGKVRHIVVGNYRVLYRKVDEGVAVLAVVHGARLVDPEGIPGNS